MGDKQVLNGSTWAPHVGCQGTGDEGDEGIPLGRCLTGIQIEEAMTEHFDLVVPAP